MEIHRQRIRSSRQVFDRVAGVLDQGMVELIPADGKLNQFGRLLNLVSMANTLSVSSRTHAST